MGLREEIQLMGRQARRASRELAVLPAERKNAILRAMADGLEAGAGRIEEANREDLERGRERGLSEAMLDRLALDGGRIRAMAQGIRWVRFWRSGIGPTGSGSRRYGYRSG
jgi:glutamate-5-semialdehyde dehydrogenase